MLRPPPLLRPLPQLLKRPRHPSLPTICTLPTAVSLPPLLIYDFRDAPIPYAHTWSLQHRLLEARRHDPNLPDALLLLQHQPVYTLGTASSLQHVLFPSTPLPPTRATRLPSSATPLLIRTERGGEVTYHGPGQLVVYPIVDLRRHRKDLHWYLRTLEDVVIGVLRRAYGLNAARKQGLTGVWVDDEKVCAMGLKVSRWITMHGFAINVCMDLTPFERIVPCGVEGLGVSSLHLLTENSDTSIEGAKRSVVDEFVRVFGPYDVCDASLLDTGLGATN